MKFEKDFDGWNEKKKKLDTQEIIGVYFHEREIWWTCLGVNVGFEQDGKNEDFERPVLIVKKFNRHVFLAVPLTSTVKDHKYYQTTQHEQKDYSIILSQLRLLSSKRLTRKVRRLPQAEFALVTKKIQQFL